MALKTIAMFKILNFEHFLVVIFAHQSFCTDETKMNIIDFFLAYKIDFS